jgi:hypothetical protein
MIGVAIIVGLVFVYGLGRSHGSDKAKRRIRGFFSDDRKGRK